MTSIRDHSFLLDSPGQSVMERAGVRNVLYTQCVSVGLVQNQPTTKENAPLSYQTHGGATRAPEGPGETN